LIDPNGVRVKDLAETQEVREKIPLLFGMRKLYKRCEHRMKDFLDWREPEELWECRSRMAESGLERQRASFRSAISPDPVPIRMGHSSTRRAPQMIDRTKGAAYLGK